MAEPSGTRALSGLGARLRALREESGISGLQLAKALGPGWRGRKVSVCRTDGFCLSVRLTDWMRADRLVDLDARTFALLAPLSRGVLTVEVWW